MLRRHTAFIGIICGLVGWLGESSIAQADTPLTHADIQQIRNQVDFIPENGSARLAELSDRLIPGDALSTRQSSFAELEFNDGTLARVGEFVLFRFQPNTRTVDLENGTLLLLIPPDQGTTNLRTPNANAGIRGSGLFVRYIEGDTPEQSTTLIGALTTSGITVANTTESLVWNDESDSFTSVEDSHSTPTVVELEAGHMAVIVGNSTPQVFSFELDLFYQTSTLVSGLDLDGDGDTSVAIWREEPRDGEHLLSVPATSTNGERDAIALVREETKDGLFAQAGTLTTPYIDNPPFVYGGDWQPSTAWLPLAPQQNPSYGEAVDNMIDAAELQTPQSNLGTVPSGERIAPPPIEQPHIVGPMPTVGPRPDRGIDIPPPLTPPTIPSPPSVPSPQPPTAFPPQAPLPSPLPPTTPIFQPTPSPMPPEPTPSPMPPEPTPSPMPPEPAPSPMPPEPTPSPMPPEPTPSPEPPEPTPNPGPLPDPPTIPFPQGNPEAPDSDPPEMTPSPPEGTNSPPPSEAQSPNETQQPEQPNTPPEPSTPSIDDGQVTQQPDFDIFGGDSGEGASDDGDNIPSGPMLPSEGSIDVNRE
ncbi:MAG: hypothetical protein AAGD25_00815 [Cyanobacteria bacterium P01_F01_bin.150]